MLQILFLGSGSSGNATIISYDSTHILLDCGFSGKELKSRMLQVGLAPENLSGLLLSHEHSDHIQALPLFKKLRDFPVYLSRGTSKGVRFGPKSLCAPQLVGAGDSFSIGQLSVRPFALSHDAYEPLGFLIDLPNGNRLGLATDLGLITPEVIEALTGCDYLCLESNHDLQMLIQGPYPWYLKQRIRSDRGHLSNEKTSSLLQKVASDRLRHLFAMHLSQTNNQKKHVQKALSESLNQMGLSVPLTVISQHQLTRFSEKKQLELL